MSANVIISFQHLNMEKIYVYLFIFRLAALFLVKIIYMKSLFAFLFLFSFMFVVSQSDFTLNDFYSSNDKLESKVELIFEQLNDTSRVGQMIVPATGRLGKSREHVKELAKKGWIGGILLLNGTVDIFTNDVQDFDSIMSANGHLPLIL